MKLVSQSQMREMDRRTIEAGRPGMDLMEVAGRGIYRSLMGRVYRAGSDHAGFGRAGSDSVGGRRSRSGGGRPAGRERLDAEIPVWILCGKGNNGGDGLVLARLLRERGLRPRVLLACSPDELTGDAAAQVPLALTSGLVIERPGPREWAAFSKLGPEAVVVDALLGTGLTGPPREAVGEWIRRIGESRARILAVDIPSGLSGDLAVVPWEVPIRADWTVTMGLPKRSFPFPPMRGRTGPVDVVDLGFERDVIDAVGWDAEIPEPPDFRSWLPASGDRSHKGRWGKLVVVGGSPGLSGAPILASRAALRVGAGLVRTCLPRGLVPVFDGALLEAMSESLPEGEDGQLLARGAEEVVSRYGTWDALVLGPGLGRFPETERFVMKLLGSWRGPLLIDADALFALAEWGADSWVPRARDVRAGGEPGGLVLTPHYGEMARLIGERAEDWSGDPIGTARKWAERWGVTLVLKGAPTVTAAPDGRAWVNPSGHYGLATGGSGDVLSGVIGALLAQGLSGPHAAVLGSYLHGRAAELGAAGARRSLLPTDVIEALPGAVQSTEAVEFPEDWPWRWVD
ncbi:MAG: NAD(P)H-hydrate dehydratase [Candidatus Eisenbacteria bacterium]